MWTPEAAPCCDPLPLPCVHSCRLCASLLQHNLQSQRGAKFIWLSKANTRAIHQATMDCPICPLAKSRMGAMASHLRTHLGYLPFACADCPLAFPNEAHLEAHARARHPQAGPVTIRKAVLPDKVRAQVDDLIMAPWERTMAGPCTSTRSHEERLRCH